MRIAPFVVLASAAALAACTTLSSPAPQVDVATAIVPGQTTRADVERIAGTPVRETSTVRNYPAEAVYMYNDVYGGKSQLSVTYDESGVVKSKFAESMPDN